MLKGNRPSRGLGQYGPSAEEPINTDNARESAVEMAKKVLKNAGVDEKTLTAKWREGGKVFDILDTESTRAGIASQMMAAQQQMTQQNLQAVPVPQQVPQPVQYQQVPQPVQVNPVAFEYGQVPQQPPPVQQQAAPPIPREGLSMQNGPRPSAVQHVTPPVQKETIFSKATRRIGGRGSGRF